jgi:glc operon protein GlcG
MKPIYALLAALPLALAAPAATAQELRPVLNAASAQTIVSTCAAMAAERGWNVSIAVLDSGADLAAFLRMDKTGLASVEVAQWKAGAAATWGWQTKQMVDRIAVSPSFALAPRVATFEGGVPIYSADGKVLLGGVGVSGAASADDAACARAGIVKAGLSDTRAP